MYCYHLQPPTRMVPRTIENTREPDETIAQPDDEEVRYFWNNSAKGNPPKHVLFLFIDSKAGALVFFIHQMPMVNPWILKRLLIDHTVAQKTLIIKKQRDE